MAGDFDYERYGRGYARQRMTDSWIASMVHEALGGAQTVLNVGAGTGSYEPRDRYVLAVEPSQAMREQRTRDQAPVVNAAAEGLPFDDNHFDASMAILTVHHWDNNAKEGIRELRRVTRGPVVILTFDGEALYQFWLKDYIPDLIFEARRRFPPINSITEYLGGTPTVCNVPIPLNCSDGFIESYYGRPERLLDPAVRQAQSSWGFVDQADQYSAVSQLRHDLKTGAWDKRFGHLRRLPQYDGALRLITSNMPSDQESLGS